MHPIAALITIAPLLGWQAGGTVDLNNLPTSLRPAATYGVTVSWPWGQNRALDIVAQYQHTTGSRTDAFGDPLSADVHVLYTQIGGRVFYAPHAHWTPYVAGTIGATWLEVNGGTTAGPSGALGAGVETQLNPRIALRLDARYHLTLDRASATIACNSSGVCASTSSGGAFGQFVASAAVAFRF